jgi:hypothetical protein
MIAITPDRLVIAGVSAAPSSLYLSKAGDYTNFTVGNAAIDSYIEVIAAPGGRLTHIEYGCGRLLWWKDKSFGYVLGTEDQSQTQVVTVSNSVGTFDNSSAIDLEGSVYFRGQEGHIYKYDCSSLEKMTVEISPNVQSSGRRTSNSFVQTTQADFQSGTILPTSSLNTTITSGSVFPSTITLTDTSSSDFGAGTANTTVDTTTVSGAFTLKTYLTDAFANMSNWTEACGGASTASSLADFDEAAHGLSTGNILLTGESIVQFDFKDTNVAPGDNESLWFGTLTAGTTVGYVLEISARNTGSQYRYRLYRAEQFLNDSGCTPGLFGGSNVQIGSDYTPGYDNSFHTVKITRTASTGAMDVTIDGTSRITGTDTKYTPTRLGIAVSQAPGLGHFQVDTAYAVARTGNFTSRVFDTAFSTPIYGTFTSGTSGGGTITQGVRCSAASGSGYTADSTITSGSLITTCSHKRYLIHTSTLSTTAVTSLPQVTDVSLTAATTGTYYSPVQNSPNVASWDTFAATTLPNDGSLSFFMRASTSAFTVLSATPSWTAQTVGSVISIATGTFHQTKVDFSMTAATNTPTLQDFTVNWYEGTAADKSYTIFFNDAVWWSVTYGTGTTVNNYIFKYDLLHPGWTLYNFGANGFLRQNNVLYFGSTGANGRIYRYGSATDDNGSAINAFWKSKDYAGVDPWLENEYTQLDVLARQNTNQSLTVTYSLANSSSTAYAVNLSSSTDGSIRHKKLLPMGKISGLFSVKVGDSTTTSSWEVLGFRFLYKPLPYRPTQ